MTPRFVCFVSRARVRLMPDVSIACSLDSETEGVTAMAESFGAKPMRQKHLLLALPPVG